MRLGSLATQEDTARQDSTTVVGSTCSSPSYTTCNHTVHHRIAPLKAPACAQSTFYDCLAVSQAYSFVILSLLSLGV